MPLNLRTGRHGCALGTGPIAFPETDRTEMRRGSRKAPAQLDSLYWHSHAARQETEFWENASFALLGASGFIGVAVSLL